MDIGSVTSNRSVEDINSSGRRDEDKKKSHQHFAGGQASSSSDHNISELRLKRLESKV